MNENEQQINAADERQRQIGLWTAGIYIALSLAFLSYSIYIVSFIQKGSFDLSDTILMPVAAIMSVLSVASFFLIRRKNIALGTGLLYYFNTLIPPIIAVLLFKEFGIISSFYIAVLTSIMITWILPPETRRVQIGAAIGSILISLGIELWNPQFRFNTGMGNFTTVVSVIAGLAIIGVVVNQIWGGLNVRAKLISTISVLSMLLIGLMTFNNIRNQVQQTETQELQQLTAIYENYNSYVSSLEGTAASLAISLADRQDLVTLYKARDRQGLLNLLTPYFNELKNYNIAHMYVSNPDGTVFVRIHNPEIYGDDIKYRKTAETALQTRQTVAGVEIGPGRLGVRGVAPLYDGDQFIGVTEIGIDYDQAFIENLKTNTNVDYTMWVTHEAATPAGLLLPANLPDAPIKEIFFYASTYPTVLTVPADAYKRVLASGIPETHYVSDEGQELVVLVAPLLGYSDRTIGVFEVISSRTQTLAVIRSDLINSLGIAALVSVIGFLSLLAISQFVVLRPIAKLTITSRKQLAGDLAVRVPELANDELGELGKTLNSLTENLQASLQGLEERVAERTTDLEQASEQIKYRAAQFESIAQVSRIINSIQNLDDLLPRITRMISQYFGFYHAGIFLLDENKEFAVLRAANSEGGRRMLERRHRLEVGQSGIVGYVTSTGNPRIALDTGADAVYFDNPDMPDTRSEMALPLRSGGNIIGALDVQSEKANAFTPEDVNILSALADQVSTAIQNARSYEESRKALAQAESAYRQLTAQAWSNIQNATPIIGYHYNGTKPEPLKRFENSKQLVAQKDAVSVPVQLRGVSIGKLQINSMEDGHQWTEDEITIIRATAERVALAIENARLVLESQKRASKEHVIGEISTKIGAAINIDNILQTTLREMGRILPGAEISIQVENE